jgi:hypothetical protein
MKDMQSASRVLKVGNAWRSEAGLVTSSSWKRVKVFLHYSIKDSGKGLVSMFMAVSSLKRVENFGSTWERASARVSWGEMNIRDLLDSLILGHLEDSMILRMSANLL